MDSSEHYPSRPVRVTLTSDLEPVTGDGSFVETSDGFCLEFCSGENNRYIILHRADETRVCSSGVLSFTIILSDRDSAVEINTEYGTVKCTVKPLSRDVQVSGGEIHISLSYLLSDGETESVRKVTAVGKFLD